MQKPKSSSGLFKLRAIAALVLLPLLFSACGTKTVVVPPNIGLSSDNLQLKAKTSQSIAGDVVLENTGGSTLNYSIAIPATDTWLVIKSGATGSVASKASQTISTEATCPSQATELSSTVTVSATGVSNLSEQFTIQIKCEAPDTTPDNFVFTNVLNATTNSDVTSAPITITGLETQTPVSASNGGVVLVNGNAAESINNNDQLSIGLRSSILPGGTITSTVNVGGILGNFSVTTASNTTSNTAPTNLTLSNSIIAENVPANSTIGTLLATDPNVGDTHSFSLVPGAGDINNSAFNISGNSLRITASPDFEVKSSFFVRIRATDAGGLSVEKNFTITITDLNEAPGNVAPTNITLSNSVIAENVPANSTIGTLLATDPNVGDTHSFSLVSGAGDINNSAFNISGNSLRINASPDFETKSSFSVRVRATDAGGLSFDKIFTIAITDLNEAPGNVAPTNIDLSNSVIAENVPANSTVGTLTAIDPNANDTHSFSLVSGAGDINNAAFNIIGSSLRITASPDFETKSSFSVRVRATDAGGLSFDKIFTIAITDVNENPVNTAPTNITLSNSIIAENIPANSTVGTLTAIDLPTNDSHSFSLVPGAGDINNAAFNISGNSLGINASPDFETKSSFSVRIRATDTGGLFFEKNFTITITDINEAPGNVAPTNITLSNNTLPENTPASSTIGTLAAIDPDAGDTQSFSLAAGTGDSDNARFSITGNILKIVVASDFESKSSYSLRLRATDAGGLFFEQVFILAVTNINEAPTAITLSSSSSAENVPANSNIGTLLATDPDTNDTHSFSLVSGAGDIDNAAFNIIGNGLRITVSPDFETKNSYSVRLRTTDTNDLFFEQVFVITIADVVEVNFAPVNTTPVGLLVNEDSTLAITGLSISDADAGNNSVEVTLAALPQRITLGNIAGLSFSVGDGSQDQTMVFTGPIEKINAALASAVFIPSQNFNGSASVSITTNDLGNSGTGGAKSDSDTFTISVNAINDRPSFAIGGSSSTIDQMGEPRVINGLITSSSSGPSDEAAQTLSYQITTDSDSAFTSLPTLSAAGLLSFTPKIYTNKTVVLTIIAVDNGGVAGGGLDTSVPVTLSLVLKSQWREISAGSAHTCGLTIDGKAYCWGNGSIGQLGNGIAATAFAPSAVLFPTGVRAWKSISAGGSHTCAIADNSKAFCWGLDSVGQLGDGGFGGNKNTPTLVNAVGVDWFSLSVGSDHTCGLAVNRQLFCWGDNFNGQLGNGTTNNQDVPLLIPTPNGVIFWQSLSVGSRHTCAISNDNKAFCWGSNIDGRIGDPSLPALNVLKPTLVAGSQAWQSISAGVLNTCAITTDSRAFCWGSDTDGQLGNGFISGNQSSPVAVRAFGAVWKNISAGGSFSCAVGKLSAGADNQAFCWGSDNNGRLGNGSGITGDQEVLSPVELSSLVGVTSWQNLSTGSAHACAIGNDSKAYCWGSDNSGRLGNGSNIDADQRSPSLVSP
jgi:alpha-tubulin suppressor-like RCC1 family protein